MYLDFYGLSKEPFQPTPDASFLYLSASHKEALGAIAYGIRQRKGFVAILGEVGVGKTTVLRSYLEMVEKASHKTIYLFNPKVTFEYLLGAILREFEAIPVSEVPAEMVSQLHELLIAEYRASRNVVLIIDEAHNIPPETLEGIRLLSNLETASEKLLQIVLVGQPELEDLLNRQDLRQVRDRIAVRAKITALSKQESLAYIEHRLKAVTREPRAIFSRGALRLIVKAARGIPRRLNILCDNALISGFGYRQQTVPAGTAKEVIAVLQAPGPRALSKHAGALAAAALAAVIFSALLYVGIETVPAGRASGPVPDLSVVSVAPSSTPPASTAPAAGATSSEGAPAQPGAAAPSPSAESTLVGKAELSETARLLAVLLDAGRVVVGRAQPAINNPRLEDKGFSSAVFESQLRQEFLTRTGHDLRNLVAAHMPERAKPLLLRLGYFMQKAVQDVQPEINKKGIGFKGFIPATFGTKVAERFSKDTGLRLRQIGPPGVAPRNPSNKPDAVEEDVLVAMEKSHPRVGDHVVEQVLPDHSVRVLLPLFYKKQCLGCHGRPKGEIDISGYEKEGFTEGQLGGAISVVLAGS